MQGTACIEGKRKTRPRPATAWTLAGKLVELRSQREQFYSQAELAEKAGVDPKVIKSIERGVGNPTLSVLEGIASALDVQVMDLLA